MSRIDELLRLQQEFFDLGVSLKEELLSNERMKAEFGDGDVREILRAATPQFGRIQHQDREEYTSAHNRRAKDGGHVYTFTRSCPICCNIAGMIGLLGWSTPPRLRPLKAYTDGLKTDFASIKERQRKLTELIVDINGLAYELPLPGFQVDVDSGFPFVEVGLVTILSHRQETLVQHGRCADYVPSSMVTGISGRVVDDRDMVCSINGVQVVTPRSAARIIFDGLERVVACTLDGLIWHIQ